MKIQKIIFEGKEIGIHSGFPFYTIGQREGLGVAVGEKIYVTEIDAKENKIFVGRDKELFHRGLIASNVNLIAYENIPVPINVTAKIRYGDSGSSAKAYIDGENKLHVIFDEPKRAITPGQSVALYEGDDVIGGGVIDAVVEYVLNNPVRRGLVERWEDYQYCGIVDRR